MAPRLAAYEAWPAAGSLVGREGLSVAGLRPATTVADTVVMSLVLRVGGALEDWPLVSTWGRVESAREHRVGCMVLAR